MVVVVVVVVPPVRVWRALQAISTELIKSSISGRVEPHRSRCQRYATLVIFEVVVRCWPRADCIDCAHIHIHTLLACSNSIEKAEWMRWRVYSLSVVLNIRSCWVRWGMGVETDKGVPLGKSQGETRLTHTNKDGYKRGRQIDQDNPTRETRGTGQKRSVMTSPWSGRGRTNRRYQLRVVWGRLAIE